MVDFLSEGSSYRSDRKVKHKAALIKMIRVLSGETDAEDVEEWLEEQGIREENEITVSELFDQYERKGRKEGRDEGIMDEERRGEARRFVTDIENAMKFFWVTQEKACEGLDTTVGGYEEPEKLM